MERSGIIKKARLLERARRMELLVYITLIKFIKFTMFVVTMSEYFLLIFSRESMRRNAENFNGNFLNVP
ncbi:hypothetical protein NK213_20115 [Sebaldella sp. S0638]|nr:hypothetical protein [Sebaldella sp. S0638]